MLYQRFHISFAIQENFLAPYVSYNRCFGYVSVEVNVW